MDSQLSSHRYPLSPQRHGGIAGCVSHGFNGRSRWNKACYQAHRIYDAPQMADDYYRQAIDWGTDFVAVLLGTQMLLFEAAHPPRKYVSFEEKNSRTPLTSVCFLDNDQRLLLGDFVGAIQELEVVDGGAITVKSSTLAPAGRTEHAACATMLRVTTIDADTQTGSAAWVGTGSGEAAKLDCRTGRIAAVCGHHAPAHAEGDVCSARLSPDGAFLATGGNDNTVRIWSTSQLRTPVVEYSAFQGGIRALTWNPTHRGLLAAGGGNRDRSISIFSVIHAVSARSGQEDDDACVCISESKNDESLVEHVCTSAQLVQLVWSHDGACLVSAHGFHTSDMLFCDAAGPSQGGNGNTEPTPGSIPRNAVAVWEFSDNRRHLQDRLTANTMQCVPMSSSPRRCLLLRNCMSSHSARPLHMAQQRRRTGEFVTAAGGIDSTIRFWSLLKYPPFTEAPLGDLR